MKGRLKETVPLQFGDLSYQWTHGNEKWTKQSELVKIPQLGSFLSKFEYGHNAEATARTYFHGDAHKLSAKRP